MNARTALYTTTGSGEPVLSELGQDTLDALKSTERGDPLTALKWCRERRYVMARYLATRARAMRPVRLPGVSL